MKKYQIRNWSEYNKGLVARGSINLWISEDVSRNWCLSNKTGKKGRPKNYSDEAILCCLLIRIVFKQPLRMLVGFLTSLMLLMNLSLKIPSYTQISRRAQDLNKALLRLSRRKPTDIVFDSTGLKVYGEGEWKVRIHGKSKRRTWRKLHICLDPKSGEILLSELTPNGRGDAETALPMLKQLPTSIERAYGDGGYDGGLFKQALECAGIEAIIPPPRNAVAVCDSKNRERDARSNAVLEIRGLGADENARRTWKHLKGYHKRSLVETMMYRIKQLTGDRLRSREFKRQKVEVMIRCLAVNRMTRLGMPKGRWVEAA
jgi:hypothetical protein